MDLLWPTALVLLAVLPLIVVAYILILRRRRRFTVRYSSLSLVRQALPRYSRLRRHLPFALFLAALASLLLALSRPVAVVAVPTNQTRIVLAMDVSRSMLSSDIPPSRLDAAEAAATSFIQQQKASAQIGIVAFAGFAETVQQPTNDRQALQAAIDSLTTGRGTAVGSGILEAIDMIAAIDPSVAPSTDEGSTSPPPTPVPQGAYAPDIIVVLTDGVSTTGPDVLESAQQAADRGVRVYTIGFGTENGGLQFGGGPFGGSPYGGRDSQTEQRFRRGIDEDALRDVAQTTGGKYYAAESADELQSVFESLPTSLITKHETTELSVAFTALGALLAAVAVALSLRWNPMF